MTIHHDKLAYGKLASGMEEMSEDKILNMLSELGEESFSEGIKSLDSSLFSSDGIKIKPIDSEDEVYLSVKIKKL